MDWFNSNNAGSPFPVIVEIEVGGTDYRFTDFDEEEPYGWPGDRYQMESVTVTVKADTGKSEYSCPVLARLHLSTPAEMAWAPKVSTDAVSGLVITVWHGRSASRKLTLNSGELPIIAVGNEGVKIGPHLIGWDDGEWEDNWDGGDHIEVFWQGNPAHGRHALGIHKWREALGPVADHLPAKINLALYMAMHKLPEERQFLILGLLQELDYLIHCGDTSPFASSPEQFILAMTRVPERILALALSLPWERACHLTGPASLMLWLEENHPQSPRRKSSALMPEESAADEEAEWPPDDMRILFAMRVAQMAGTFSQADADRMDEGPPETWPLEIWQKLGFAPPSPASTNENLMTAPSSHAEPSGETSAIIKPETPITAEVNIHATGDLYRITRDTTSHLCDGEEVLVYDFVKVDVVLEPEEEEGAPLVLESVTFRPEDEDFPLPHMPPAPPHIGQVERTTFTSRMQADIQLASAERPDVRISHSGVTVADHHFSWETIHERGGLDQSYPSSAYFHGVGLSAEMEDLIFHFRPGSAAPRKTIIRHLANEIDFIAAHTPADGFDGSPADLVVAMHDDLDIILRAVLAMPWDHARRICGPVELEQWIEVNHPESPKRRMPIPQTPPSPKTVNSSASPTPSSTHLEHPLSDTEIMFGLMTPLPPEATKLDVREITRVKPDKWTPELREALLPKWKDNKGEPLPTDVPMCNLKGELNYPKRILV